MTTKKLKYGTYTLTANLSYQDEIDLADHIDKSEWDKMTLSQQESWLADLTESCCLPAIEYDYKLEN